jgi:CrcB protein
VAAPGRSVLTHGRENGSGRTPSGAAGEAMAPETPVAAAPALRDWRLLLAIVAGGFLGTVLRAGLGELWPHTATEWPWPTFIANVAGALALGYFATWLRMNAASSTYRRSFLVTGFCGGLTTFSTLQVEVIDRFDAGSTALGLAYLATSLAAGLIAVMAGARLAGERPVAGA